MNSRPNIVFIVIDALRYDRLGVAGYSPKVTPFLDTLARKGILCNNLFSAGCPTQVAFPSIFTSTLPLDYGGYSEGIHNRPSSFVEILQSNGYETFGVSSVHSGSSHYGYDRGFDKYINLIDIFQWFQSNYISYIKDSIDSWEAGLLSDNKIVDFLNSKYGFVLSDSLKYLDQLDEIGASERGIFKRPHLREMIDKEQKLLIKDPIIIARKFVTYKRHYQLALGEADIRPGLQKEILKKNEWRKKINRKIALIADRDAYQGDFINNLIFRHMKKGPKNPFFYFLHYFDLHESGTIFANLRFLKSATLPLDVVRASIGREKGNRGSMLYDIALSKVDRLVNKLIQMIKKLRLFENTIFIITGDHGKRAGMPERPNESRVTDLSQGFYDNKVHVPLIIYGSNISPERNDSLMSHLDIGPTILDLAGIDIPQGFLGLPVSIRRNNSAPYVLAENAGDGRCDINRKTLYLSIRTKKIKVVFEAKDFIIKERDVFNILDDPCEYKNLRDTNILMKERLECASIIDNRLSGIRDYLKTNGPKE